jgi:hypothetical protein
MSYFEAGLHQELKMLLDVWESLVGARFLLLRAYRNWDFPKGLVEPGVRLIVVLEKATDLVGLTRSARRRPSCKVRSGSMAKSNRTPTRAIWCSTSPA